MSARLLFGRAAAAASRRYHSNGQHHHRTFVDVGVVSALICCLSTVGADGKRSDSSSPRGADHGGRDDVSAERPPALPTLTSEQAFILCKCTLDTLRTTYRLPPSAGNSADGGPPSVRILQRGAADEKDADRGYELSLSGTLSTAAGAHGPADAATSWLGKIELATQECRGSTLAAVLTLLAVAYPLAGEVRDDLTRRAEPDSRGALLWESLRTSEGAIFLLPVPGGLVTVDVRKAPFVELAWKPLPVPSAPGVPPQAGAAVPVGVVMNDIRALVLVHAAMARGYRSGLPFAPSPSSSLLPALPSLHPDLEAALPEMEAIFGIVREVEALMAARPVAGPRVKLLDTLRSASAAPAAPVRHTSTLTRASKKLEEAAPEATAVEEDDDDESPTEQAGGAYGSGGLGGGSGSGGPGKPPSIDPKKMPKRFLRSLGIKVYNTQTKAGSAAAPTSGGAPLAWDDLAGAAEVRTAVEEGVLLPLRHPHLYAAVTGLTRVRPEPNTHGTYLFEGPPGTGKTTTARIIAALADRPLVELSFENIGSSYFAATENNFARVLTAVQALPGAILLVDEAEALFPSRYGGGGGGGHATPGSSVTSAIGGKLLSQMLRFLEGMSGGASNSVVLASNTAGALDPALLSRVASTVSFTLPDAEARAAIWGRYAKHLPPASVGVLVEESDGMSGRDVKRVAEVAERRHVAAALLAGDGAAAEGVAPSPPPLAVYSAVLAERADGVLALGGAAGGKADFRRRQGGLKWRRGPMRAEGATLKVTEEEEEGGQPRAEAAGVAAAAVSSPDGGAAVAEAAAAGTGWARSPSKVEARRNAEARRDAEREV